MGSLSSSNNSWSCPLNFLQAVAPVKIVSTSPSRFSKASMYFLEMRSGAKAVAGATVPPIVTVATQIPSGFNS